MTKLNSWPYVKKTGHLLSYTLYIHVSERMSPCKQLHVTSMTKLTNQTIAPNANTVEQREVHLVPGSHSNHPLHHVPWISLLTL